MKKTLTILAMFLVLIVGVIVVKNKTSNPVQSEPEAHYHAGFIVFDNGKKVDFGGLQYMDIEPCDLHEEEEEETPEHNQLEKAHLHDSVPDVVHSHRENAKWGDLFTNIKYEVDYSKVTAFINGKEVDDIQNTLITGNDSLVIFVGNVNKSLLSQAVTIDHIKEVESKSESCGK